MKHYPNSQRVHYPITAPYRALALGRRRVPVPDRIGRISVPLAVMEATSRIMGAFGEKQRECYVWWGGYFMASGDAQVLTVYCPDIVTQSGRVHLRLGDFHTVHNALRERDQVLVVELHTHPPGAGGQNEVDAAYAAAPYPGFVSIVVPDFGLPYLHDLRRCHVYEYMEVNYWTELGADAIAQKFAIEETFVEVRSDDAI